MPSVLSDRYELRGRIGSGGMATVWRGFDRRLSREVAVKILSEALAADERFRHRFEREAHHIGSLAHPNIVVVHDFDSEGDQLFIVMELVRGKTLRQVLAESSVLSPERVAHLAGGVLAGLGHAHEAGILHRDIKPGNILINESGVSKLADFGIAKATEETIDLTDSGAILGTVSYASPEQLSGQPLGPSSDLYSLGCVLYECLAGRPPFVADNIVALVSQQQFVVPKHLRDVSPGVPPALGDAIMRALEKDSAKRFVGAGEMKEAFEAVGRRAANRSASLPDSTNSQPSRLTAIEDGVAVPLPARLAGRPQVGVVGREPELGTIASAYKRVSGGEGREVILIGGEAGTGKTTVAAEASRAAFDDGACVLLGRCEEELATPYQLFAEALTQYVTHADKDILLAHVVEHGSELARMVPALERRLPGLPASRATDSDTERYLLFTAVVGLFALASQYQPLVLVLEDLQWADTGSLQLLRHLAAAELKTRVLVIGTFRDSELSRSHPLIETLGALRRHSGVARIELKGLDDTGVMSFLEAAAGHALDDAGVQLAHAVYRETDGNPFFVGEVLRHLSETGALYQDDSGRWVGIDGLEDLALPDSVREVIGARVVRLGEGAQRVLSLAAVIGRDFDLEVLALVTETSEDELLEVLDSATSAALVREVPEAPGRYCFAHALIQHTLYEDLGATRRARAHRRVGEALEDICSGRPGARVGELAHHWFSATQPKDVAKALEYSRQAADAALDALAPGDALRYYGQALDLYAQDTHHHPLLGVDLSIGLGTAQRQSGNPAWSDTLLDAARRAADLGDTQRLVAAALANDRGNYSAVGIIDADKVAILDTALARLPADHPDRTLLLANLCKELTFGSPLERRRALADEAVSLARSSGDDATITRVLNHVFNDLLVPSLLEQSLTRTAEALARAERVGDPVLLFWATRFRHVAAACAGDIDELDRCLESASSLVTQLNQPTLNWVHRYACATRALIAGDVDWAEQLATEALQIGTDSGQPDASALFGSQLMAVSLQRGTLGELVPLIEQVAAENPGVPTFVAALALAHAEGNRTDEARQLLDALATAGFEHPQDLLWLTGMVCYAEAAIECGDPAYAGPLYERLLPWADRLVYDDATTAGPVSHYLGGLATVLGRYDEADAYFAQSAAWSNHVDAKFFAARTDLSRGKMLVERRSSGDVEKALELLTKAHTAALAYGYATVAGSAAEALQNVDS